jgi:hypothetical protein
VDYLLNAQSGKIDVLELEPGVVEAQAKLFPDDRIRKNPRVEIKVEDARYFLKKNGKRAIKKYDLIASMPAHPWVAASIFTEEFFEATLPNLSEQGVFSTWFGDSGMSSEAILSLFSSFSRVFPHSLIYRIDEVGAYFLLGSLRPLTLDEKRLNEVHAQKDVQFHPLLKSSEFLPKRIFAVLASQDPIEVARRNTDDRAVVEARAPISMRTRMEENRNEIIEAALPRVGPTGSYFPKSDALQWGEVLLGTAEGSESELIYTPQIDSLRRWLRGRPLPVGYPNYFEGRLLYLRGNFLGAREKFEKAQRECQAVRESCEQILFWAKESGRPWSDIFSKNEIFREKNGDWVRRWKSFAEESGELPLWVSRDWMPLLPFVKSVSALQACISRTEKFPAIRLACEKRKAEMIGSEAKRGLNVLALLKESNSKAALLLSLSAWMPPEREFLMAWVHQASQVDEKDRTNEFSRRFRENQQALEGLGWGEENVGAFVKKAGEEARVH